MFGLGRSRILFSEESMGGQMQNVGRMDLEQRFFCRGVLGEVDRRPTPADKLLNKFIALYLRALQTPEAPIFDFPLFAAADGARIGRTLIYLGEHCSEIKIRIGKQNDFPSR